MTSSVYTDGALGQENHQPLGYTIEDDRTPEEIENTIGFWVATDSFLSNWKSLDNEGENIVNRSIVACPVTSPEDKETVHNRFLLRDEFKRVRFIYGNQYRPKMNPKDHLHIYGTTKSFRYPL